VVGERFFQSPIEQCLNLVAKNYLCYASWLRMCQLLQCWQVWFFNVEYQLLLDQCRSTWELDWWPIEFCTNWHLELRWSTSHLDDLDKSLNLCYRFTLLIENNARISKSLPSLNAAVWDADECIFYYLKSRILAIPWDKNYDLIWVFLCSGCQ